MEILTGVLLGLSTLLFIGPVFFYLLKSAMENGFKAGLAVAAGIIIGDIIYVTVVLLGFGTYLEEKLNLKWFALIGGVLLLFFGVNYLFNSTKKKKSKEKFKSRSLFYYGLNGFLINFINPFVLAVWIGFYTFSKTKYGDEKSVVVSLFFALLIIFATDALKAYYANKLSNYFSTSNLKKIYQVFGIIMIGFSIRLFYEFIKS